MADKAKLSLGRSKNVCGYEIKKLPIGAYLNALKLFENFPKDFMNVVFQGKSLREILDNLKTTENDEEITKLLAGVLYVAPNYIISVISELTDISEDALLTDSNIGLDGLIDIIGAFIEVNSLGKCVSGAKGLMPKVKSLKMR